MCTDAILLIFWVWVCLVVWLHNSHLWVEVYFAWAPICQNWARDWGYWTHVWGKACVSLTEGSGLVEWFQDLVLLGSHWWSFARGQAAHLVTTTGNKLVCAPYRSNNDVTLMSIWLHSPSSLKRALASSRMFRTLCIAQEYNLPKVTSKSMRLKGGIRSTSFRQSDSGSL